MADRTDLARLRQLMRVKQSSGNTAKPKTKAKKSTTSDGATATSPDDPAKPPKKPKPTKRTSSTTATVPVKHTSATSALGSTNMALIVRQVLQRTHYGDVTEYLNQTRKSDLLKLLAQIAQYAYELKEKQQAEASAAQSDHELLQQRIHNLTGRLLDVETQLTTSHTEQEQLVQRLQVSQDEYSCIVDDLRKYEAQWDATQTTMAQQQQLLQEMSRSLDERTRQVDSQSVELETTHATLAETQQQNTELRNQLQVRKLESERSQQQQTDERRENKALLWELQTKTRDCDDLTNQLDDAKARILTLEGQIQVELFTSKSLAQERDAARLLHQREREDWKAAQAARKETEQHKSQEFRSLDLEVRQLKQTVGRLRSELEMEQTHREKAEDTARKATDIADELKAAGKSLHFDVQRLTSELQEERAARESKEGALTLAYRELQALHKRVRDEETARTDAQAEVEALSHRMKLIRRDHLAMLHRVETPPQLTARWKEPASRYTDSVDVASSSTA